MAVSKIAVMALVGILAVPILLGYALNLSEVTETDYTIDNNPINVTPLIQNSMGYSSAHGDTSNINIFNMSYADTNGILIPRYESFTTTKSTLFLQQNSINPPGLAPGNFNNLAVAYYAATVFLDTVYSATDYLRMTITFIDSSNQTITRNVLCPTCWFYDDSIKTLTYSYYSSPTNMLTDTVESESINLSYSKIGNYNGRYYYNYYAKNQNTNVARWVNLSAGYHFEGKPNAWAVKLSDSTNTILMSMNLNSITDSNYDITIGTVNQNYQEYQIRLVKTTTNGVVAWSAQFGSETPIDLYYDQSISDNTYQFYFDINKSNEDATYKYFNEHIELRYVGHWPTVIGPANQYTTYQYDAVRRIPNNLDDLNLGYIYMKSPSASAVRSPTIRIDDTLYNAFQYPAIENKVYDPSKIKVNPSTEIKNVVKYGTSIDFGGQTFNVSSEDGNLILGTHKVSIKGIKFQSIPVPVGYENRINDNVISVTATPSTIGFNGLWDASVTTDSLTATTYTKTEWVAGQFAWDGMDTNFLIVGLITCLGVFVALGIYVRKSGKGMIPLLIVCGCCAGLFFCMI